MLQGMDHLAPLCMQQPRNPVSNLSTIIKERNQGATPIPLGFYLFRAYNNLESCIDLIHDFALMFRQECI